MSRLLAILAAVSFIVAACNNPSSTSTSTSQGGANANEMLEKNKATALAADEAFNSHDVAGIFKNAAPDVMEYADGSIPPAKGIDSCKAIAQIYMNAFPDMKGSNFMAIAEGNHVAIFGDWTGTFKADFMGMKPTGKSFNVKDVDLFTFNDKGQITEHRTVQSNITYMSQVGVQMK
jgi:predicted ester cyclase